MRRPAGLLVIAALSAGCAVACTSEHGAPPPSARPDAGRVSATPVSPTSSTASLAEPWAHEHPPADCPVTLGSANSTPPSSIPANDLPVPWVANWLGGPTLWTRLPPTGVLPVHPGEPGQLAWAVKFPWWRTRPGRLTISARRLGGGSAAFSADVPAGYAPTGFQPSELDWSAPGCWRIVADNAGGTLAFTVWLEPLPST